MSSNTQASTIKRKALIIGIAFILLIIGTLTAIYQKPHPNAYRTPEGLMRIIDQMVYPIEANPTQRLPWFAKGFYNIDGYGPKIWVIGDAGTILHSPDKGISWRHLPLDTKQKLRGIAFSKNGRTGLMCGENGLIARSTDGGITWNPVKSPVTTTLFDVAMSDNDTGWACGVDGVFLQTVDRGETWKQIPLSLKSDLYDMAATKNGTMYLCGKDGTLVKYDGKTWTHFNTEWNVSFYTISFIDDNTGWTADFGGNVYNTTDGGQSWQKISNLDSTMPTIKFIDINTGWATADDGDIVSTTDGGKTWTEYYNPLFSQSLKHMYINASSIFICDDNGRIYSISKSNNSSINSLYKKIVKDYTRFDADYTLTGFDGLVMTSSNINNWTVKNARTSTKLNSVTMPLAKETYISGDNGVLRYSTSSRTKWQYMKTNLEEDLVIIHFTDYWNGFFITKSGLLAYTEDGGESWQQMPDNNFSYFYDIDTDFFDDKQGILTLKGSQALFATSDSGRSWNEILLPGDDTSSILNLSCLNTNIGWAISGNGTLYKTVDTGQTWQVISKSEFGATRAIHFQSETNGYISTTNNDLYKTGNSGVTWSKLNLTTNSPIIFIDFTNTLHGVVGTIDGSLYRTKDRGETWTKANRYSKYPAGWYYSFLLGITLMLVAAYRIRERKTFKGIESIMAADKPIECEADDLLGFTEVAGGLCNFITNPNTKPPLTIAITGEWGSGKSSMMKLTTDYLSKNGFNPVWFNAWHHQSEEKLLQSLLANIKSQAIPSFIKPGGLLFYSRLLWRRVKRYWLGVVIILILYMGLASFLYGINAHNEGTMSLKDILRGDFIDFSTEESLFVRIFKDLFFNKSPLMVLFLNTIATGTVIIKSLKPFNVNINSLVTNLTSGLPGASKSPDPGFKQKFADEFGEVIQALGHKKPVIIIDDLDRCDPANVVAVLEAINFLVSSGECFVLLGIAYERVRGAVALHFNEISDILVKDDEVNPARAGHKHQKPLEYADKYLRKLINIEIPTPKRKNEELSALIQGNKHSEIKYHNTATTPIEKIKAYGPHYLRICLKHIKPFFNVTVLLGLFALIVVFIGFKLGTSSFAIFDSNRQLIRATTPIPTKVPTDVTPAPTSETTPRAIPTQKPIISSEEESQVFIENDEPRHVFFWVFGAMIILGLGILIEYVLRDKPVEDSEAFTEALKAWASFIITKDDSPREIRRFQNRTRYYAMRCRPAVENGHRYNGGKNSDIQPLIPDHYLVALASLHHYNHAWLEDDIIWEAFKTLLSEIETITEDAMHRLLTNYKHPVHEKAHITKLVQSAKEFSVISDQASDTEHKEIRKKLDMYRTILIEISGEINIT